MKNHNQSNRRQIIEELRYRMRYANPLEREAIRRELDFWIHQH